MRRYFWLGGAALLSAGLAVAAVCDYAHRHPESALARWLGKGAAPTLAVPGDDGSPAHRPAAADRQTPVIIIDLSGQSGQSSVDPRTLEQLRLISARDPACCPPHDDEVLRLHRALFGMPRFTTIDPPASSRPVADEFTPRRMPLADEDEPRPSVEALPARKPAEAQPARPSGAATEFAARRAVHAVAAVSDAGRYLFRWIGQSQKRLPAPVPVEVLPVVPKPVPEPPKKGDKIARQLFGLGWRPLFSLAGGFRDASLRLVPYQGFLLWMPRLEDDVLHDSAILWTAVDSAAGKFPSASARNAP